MAQAEWKKNSTPLSASTLASVFRSPHIAHHIALLRYAKRWNAETRSSVPFVVMQSRTVGMHFRFADKRYPLAATIAFCAHHSARILFDLAWITFHH
jgi:hypothetical protein